MDNPDTPKSGGSGQVRSLKFPYPFATRLPEPLVSGERYRVERVLAGARLFLASASMVAIVLDPTDPRSFAKLAYGMMALYVVHSVVVLLLLRGRYDVSSRFSNTVQAIDLLFPAVISTFTEGPNSPFFFICFFALMAAAFRWGFRAAIRTTAIALGLLLGEFAIVQWGRSLLFVYQGELEINRFVIRAAFLVTTGILIGYAAEEERQLRSENMVIARMAARARATEGSLSATMLEFFSEALHIFNAGGAMVAVRENSTGRVFHWFADRDEHAGIALRVKEAEYEERGLSLFPVSGDAWLAEKQPSETGSESWRLTAIDAEGRQLRDLPRFQPLPGSAREHHRALLGISFAFGDAFSGRVLIFDPHFIGSSITELRFAQNMVQQVGPAVYNLYLVRRLRSRAGAIERARAARELHDGAIQSLIAAEMQVDVLRRRASSGVPMKGGDLERVQQILRQEILSLRELMQQMRPLNVGPLDLLDFLSETVERFRRDTGIAARFVPEMEEIALPPRVCREIARIAQEALFNIRRHSGASHVLMRFRADNGWWKLLIEDDGRGFSFSGRLTGDQMEATHQGPLVIRERVRQIGGQLTIESIPGQGSRLEIALPQQVRATYA